jgi:hypothetical protein
VSRTPEREERASHRRARRQSLRDALWPESEALRETMSRALSSGELPEARVPRKRPPAEPGESDQPRPE